MKTCWRIHWRFDFGNDTQVSDNVAIDELSITVLGIEFGVDANTFFENGVPIAGDNVEVEDDGDGIADSVEIED